MNTLWNFFEKIIRACLKGAFRLFGKELSEENMNGFMQFVKFALVGISNTLVHYLVYMVVLLVLQQAVIFPQGDYLIANVAAFLLSVLWSFYWNNRFVFQENRESRNLWKALLKTYLSYAFTGLILQSILSILWVEVVHLPKTVAPLINLVITVPVNFLLNKYFAFREQKHKG